MLAWPSGSADNASAFFWSLASSPEAFELCPCAFETRPPTGLARRDSAATAEIAATCTPVDLSRRGASAAAALQQQALPGAAQELRQQQQALLQASLGAAQQQALQQASPGVAQQLPLQLQQQALPGAAQELGQQQQQ